jgi:lipopolysaccharide export LptBFGC system permease protein LptF
MMRGASINRSDVLNRRWVVGSNGDFYRYDHFDPDTNRFLGLSVYEFTSAMQGLARRTFAERASRTGTTADGRTDNWRLEKGWTREFDQRGELRGFVAFDQTTRPLDKASYFVSEQPDSRYMSYTQLRDYTARLRSSGFDVLAQQVALARKLAFPFITLIMTLIAVPFAVTTGRAGAMAGVGVGIALAMTYWTTINVFAAFGAGGLIAPTLAAWAPNLLFGAGAIYLLLTVRT